MSATWAVGVSVRPGAGQARITVLTGTACDCGTGWPAATVTVWFHTARPAAAARATTTPTRGSIRLVLMLLTSRARSAHRVARDPSRHRAPGPAHRGAPGPIRHAGHGPARRAPRRNAGRRRPTGSGAEPGAAAGATVTAPGRRRAGGRPAWAAWGARRGFPGRGR